MSASRPNGRDPTDAEGGSRRAFLGGVAGLAVAAGALPLSALSRGALSEAHGDPPAPGPAAAPVPMPLRDFGRTGLKVSVFGLGCFSIGGIADDAEAVAVVRRALDQGCTYLDTAPSYADGASERRVGAALKGRPRASYVLATKTHTRTEREARHDVERSLERLGVEFLDLVQVHSVTDEADLERALAKDGPLAALAKARDEKLVRFLGVTGHRHPAVVRAALERHDFDAVLLPLNCVDPHHRSFVAGTLPAAVERGVARVAMKVFAGGKLAQLGVDPEDCLRYVYGLDVSAAIVGCGTREQVDLAASVARQARRLTAAEEQALLARTLSYKGPDTEWYKRSS